MALTLISTLLLVAIALHFSSLASAGPRPLYPFVHNTEMPTFKVESPQNGEAYTVNTVELVLTVTKPDSWNFYWLGDNSGTPLIGDYCVWVYLDGNLNGTYLDPHLKDTPTTNYSLILDGLTRGGHSLKIDVKARTFYRNPYDDYDPYEYLMNASETIHFTINQDPSTPPPEPQQGPFPTTIVVASTALVVLVIIGLLVYFKKRKR